MKSAIALVAIAFSAGASLAWRLKPDPPAKVELREVVRWKEREQKTSSSEVLTGPVRIVERWRVKPGPGCSSPEEEHEREIDRAPVLAKRSAAEARTATGSESLDLRIVQAPRPSWAVYGGLQLVPEKLPVLGLSRRVAGPVWFEVWLRPRLELELPAAGAQLRVEF